MAVMRFGAEVQRKTARPSLSLPGDSIGGASSRGEHDRRMAFKLHHFTHGRFILLMRLMLMTPESVFKVTSDDAMLTSSPRKAFRTAR